MHRPQQPIRHELHGGGLSAKGRLRHSGILSDEGLSLFAADPEDLEAFSSHSELRNAERKAMDNKKDDVLQLSC